MEDRFSPFRDLERCSTRAGVVFAVFSAASLFAGCSSSPAADGQSESAYTVHPTGGTTELLVHAPDGAVTPTVTYGSAALSLDAPYTFAPGTGALGVKAEDRDMGVMSLSLAAAARTTVTLAGFKFIRASTDRVVGLDLHPCVDSATPGCDYPWTIMDLDWIVGSVASKKIFPHAPGLARYYVGPNIVTGTLREGVVDTLPVDDPTDRYAVRILPPASREFPDLDARFRLSASIFGFSGEVTIFSTDVLENLGDTPLLFLARRNDDDLVRFSYGPFGLPAAHIVIQGSGQLLPVPEIQFQRLDVDDVEVSLLDGTKKMVPGTFVAWLGPSAVGTPLLSGPTKHGADVPPGKYHVEVGYKHPVTGEDQRFKTDIELK